MKPLVVLAQYTDRNVFPIATKRDDGKKTGLTHQEFNQLRAKRHQQARNAIALAQGGGK